MTELETTVSYTRRARPFLIGFETGYGFHRGFCRRGVLASAWRAVRWGLADREAYRRRGA